MNASQVYQHFPAEDDCVRLLEQLRWKGKPICPYCEANRATRFSCAGRYHCNNCFTSFSVTVNTVFHNTRIPLSKWFVASILLLQEESIPSVRGLAKELQVNKNTAWYIARRIQDAMQEPSQVSLLEKIVQWNQI